MGNNMAVKEEKNLISFLYDPIQKPSSDLVDKELVKNFLALSTEERICSNNNAIQAIIELRNGVLNAKCC